MAPMALGIGEAGQQNAPLGRAVVGGLAAVAFPTAWILVNAISSGPGSIAVTQVRIGAYGAAIGGFMTLILAAVAVDTRVPTVR